MTSSRFERILVVVAIVTAVGCGGGDPEIGEQVDDLATAACACRDAVCAKTVSRKMDTVFAEMKTVSSPAKTDRAMRAMTRAGSCLADQLETDTRAGGSIRQGTGAGEENEGDR